MPSLSYYSKLSDKSILNQFNVFFPPGLIDYGLGIHSKMLSANNTALGKIGRLPGSRASQFRSRVVTLLLSIHKSIWY